MSGHENLALTRLVGSSKESAELIRVLRVFCWMSELPLDQGMSAQAEWSRVERTRLGLSLVEFEDGRAWIGTNEKSSPRNAATLAHIDFLEVTIEQLTKDIRNCETPIA